MYKNNIFFDKVHNYIIDNKMIQNGDKIIIGVSGGADSMCLLNVLSRLIDEYSLGLYVVHIHHGIRGVQADEDEQFVKKYCTEIVGNNKIKYFSFFYDIPKMAKEQKLSEEEMGRKVRYEAFDEIKNKYNADKIAVAHNLNDNAETVLFNICRGTGINGLKGIINKKDDLIRPLLCVSRKEIEEYLYSINVEYRQDMTNFEEEYTRNRIRLKVIPYLEENINSNVVEHINSMAMIAKDTEGFMADYTDSVYDKVVSQVSINNCIKLVVDVKALNKEKNIIQQRIIRKCIYNIVGKLKDVSNVHIEDILKLSDKNVGKRIEIPYNIIAQRDYNSIEIFINDILQDTNIEKKQIFEEIRLNYEYYLGYYDKHIIFEVFDREEEIDIPKDDYTKWFDYDKIDQKIILRNRNSGDKMQLNPEGTTKKLKDLMINLKINKNERDSIPLVAEGSNVLWLIGKRNSEAYRVDDSTKRILQIKVY